jgi:pyruvate dehydrogenase E2 component (dihydrolipoamide acetyltransferase)
MIKEFKLPNLGENISSAEITKLLVAVGDKLEKDQPVAEISSDKATIEVPADVEGIVKEIRIKEGDSVTEGQTLITVETDGAAPAPKAEEKAEKDTPPQSPSQEGREEKAVSPSRAPTNNISLGMPATAQSSPVTRHPEKVSSQFVIPNLGENISEAEILKVLVKAGDKVEKDQPLIEIGSDKATLEVPSDVSGIVKEVTVKEGDMVKEGQVILTLEPDETTEAPEKTVGDGKEGMQGQNSVKPKPEGTQPKPSAEPQAVRPAASRPKEIAPAAPSVRRFAREIGIDINQVPGTGHNGRISVEDIKTYSRQLHKGGIAVGKPAGGYTEQLPDFSRWGEITREAMNNIRFKTAQHLGYAWTTIPHVTHFEKTDISELEKLRKEYSKKVETSGGKLTITAILIKVISSALKAFPKFNASIDLEKKEIIYKKYYNIGLAVDTDRGLLVPVIRDAAGKNVTQISIEVGQLAEKARNKKLAVEDMQGATFTISNLGGIGGVGFTPVVNSPEVAILGVSKSSYEPVYQENGQFEPRLIMPISLSYDHRLIDGADAARFMKWVKEAIENPFLLMLEG